ncbi:MAG: GNAT family N-acetyltransferase [Sphingobacteriaceae bacterium]|nr:GNAT family N-acetyltransferase [Sphingobacteriaceae bacterium]
MLAPNFTPFPTLTTNRLVLRQITVEDAPELFFQRTDERVMKYIERPRPKDINDTITFINTISDLRDKNEIITWGIALKENPKLIGTVVYLNFKKEHYRAEFGYALHPDYWRKGIMDEVAKAVIDYGFNVMKLHSIEANINPENIASQKLLEKHKFVKEAYFKENFFWQGKFLDSAIYSLLNPNG